MTYISSLQEFANEDLQNYLDEEVDDPDEWYVLNGMHATEYSIWDDHDLPEDYDEMQAEMAPEDRDANPNAKGMMQIGTLGWSAEVFDFPEDGDGFVATAQWGDEVDTLFLGTLVVHQSVLSEKAIAAANGRDPEEVDA